VSRPFSIFPLALFFADVRIEHSTEEIPQNASPATPNFRPSKGRKLLALSKEIPLGPEFIGKESKTSEAHSDIF